MMTLACQAELASICIIPPQCKPGFDFVGDESNPLKKSMLN